MRRLVSILLGPFTAQRYTNGEILAFIPSAEPYLDCVGAVGHSSTIIGRRGPRFRDDNNPAGAHRVF
jgi:hypothetical protein